MNAAQTKAEICHCKGREFVLVLAGKRLVKPLRGALFSFRRPT
jgi:hypothetical protein